MRNSVNYNLETHFSHNSFTLIHLKKISDESCSFENTASNNCNFSKGQVKCFADFEIEIDHFHIN